MLVQLQSLDLQLVKLLDVVLGTRNDVSCCLGELGSFDGFLSLGCLLSFYCSFCFCEGDEVVFLVARSAFLQSNCIEVLVGSFPLFSGLE